MNRQQSVQLYRSNYSFSTHLRATVNGTSGASAALGGGKTVGRWLKERKERRKEENRVQNAQLHAAVSVAGVAAAIAAIASASVSSTGVNDGEEVPKTDIAMASAATLVAAQCVEAAEAMGAEHDHLASVISSAVNVRSAGDIMTLTAAAATGCVVFLFMNPTNFYKLEFLFKYVFFFLKSIYKKIQNQNGSFLFSFLKKGN